MSSTTSATSAWDALQSQLDTLKRPTDTLRLCRDPEIRDRYLAAKQVLERAQAYRKSLGKDTDADALALVDRQVKDAKTEFTAAEKAYSEATIVLRFQALERQDLEDLQNKHPATEEDEAEGRDVAFDDFAPALIAASSLDGMPEDYARKALNTWATGDADDLWNAAWGVQHKKRSDLGKG